MLTGRRRSRQHLPLLVVLLTFACKGDPPAAAPWERAAAAAARQPLVALEVYRQAVDEGAVPEAELAAARLLARYQKLGWSIALARRLAAAHPQRADIWRLRYELALQLGAYDEARQAAEEVWEREGRDPVLARHLGVLTLREHEPARAVELLIWATREEPGNPVPFYALGRALEMAKKPRQAVAAYARCTDLDPAHAGAARRRARLLMRDGELGTARQLLEGLRATDQLNRGGRYLLGQLLVRQGEREEGEALLQEHLRRSRAAQQAWDDSLRRKAQLEKALERLEAGDGEAARTIIEALRPLSGGQRHLDAYEAEAWALLGSPSRAAELSARAVRRAGGAWRYRYLHARHLAALGLLQDALHELDAVLAAQPLSWDAHRLRRQLLARRGADPTRLQEADAHLATLAFWAPGDVPDPQADEALPGQILFELIRIEETVPPVEADGIEMD